MIEGWRRDQARRGLMASSASKRCCMMRTFNAWCDGDLTNATREDIERFLDERRTARGEPISARTRYTWISCLDCFYRWACRNGHAEWNPAAAIERPKLRKTLPRPISDDDLTFALANTDGQMRVWMILAHLAGLRCAEIATLDRDDILHDLGMIRVVGKGQKERLIPMHPTVAAELRAYPMPKVNGHIFRRPNGHTWKAAEVSRETALHLRYIGVNATLHQFRHWFGTRALRACGNIRTVQELMGHASPTTTAIYTAFCNEDGRAAVLALTPPSEPEPAPLAAAS
jgi:integrase/recombinase XerC